MLTPLKTRALEAWLRREWCQSDITDGPQEDNCFSNVKGDKALAQLKDISKTKFEDAATATAVARSRGSQPNLFQ